jgi:hypothetical protein
MTSSNTPMFAITVYGNTMEELKENLRTAVAEHDGEDAVEEETAPVTKKTMTAVEKKAAEARKAAGSSAKVNAPKTTTKTTTKKAPEPEPEEDPTEEEDDPLGENADEGDAEEITKDDVLAVLVEVKAAFPQDPTAVSTLVQKYGGGVKKLGDVDPEHYPALKAAAEKKLKTAKR